ncbi:unnamed protein product, partial [Closterium sp. Naga37s-1]
ERELVSWSALELLSRQELERCCCVRAAAGEERARGDADCCVGARERRWLTGVGDGAVLLRPWKHGVDWRCCCVGGGAAVLEAVLLCW